MIALVALIVIAVFRSRIVESIILGSAVMDEYKFVNPSAPPACVKAFSLPPAHPDQIQFQPPTLPQNLGDKGAEGKQKLAAQMTAWITMILIIITLLAILYAIFKKCRYVSSLPRVCFPLYPFSTILRGTARTDIFVEVVNLASAEAMRPISHPWQYTHCNCRSQVTLVHMTCISLNFVAADSCRLTGRILFCAIWTGI